MPQLMKTSCTVLLRPGVNRLRQDNLEPLTGTMRYQGDATGMYFEPTEQPLGGYSFEAHVTLEATFDDSGGLGHDPPAPLAASGSRPIAVGPGSQDRRRW